MEVLAAIVVGWIIWIVISNSSSDPAPSSASPNPEPLRIQCTLVPPTSQDAPFDAIHVLAKGIIPLDRARDVRFVTSVLDNTGETAAPVISTIDAFREPESAAYQHTMNGGRIAPLMGFADWTRVGVVIPEILIPPHSGRRELLVVLRIADAHLEPDIDLGFGEKSDPAVISVYSATISHVFKTTGYEEAAEQRTRVLALGVQLSVAVAVADGSLDETEGNVIREWIKTILTGFSGSRRESIRDACNQALKKAYADSKSGGLSLGSLCQEINTLADHQMKFQLIELCFDVMAADGTADVNELKLIRRVADALELDYDEVQKIKDQRMVTLDAGRGGAESLEEVLGIEPQWDTATIRKHLRGQFSKWNGRLTNLQDAAERDNAQRMLDLIAEARKKYG